MLCDYCSWISQLLVKIHADAQKQEDEKSVLRVDPVIVVHGGAGKIPRYMQKFMLEEVKRAAVTAYCDLIKGHSSLHAVERAIRHMESKKYFNCAYGGSLDANGEVVTDAAIMMDGFRAGCVGAVRNIAHPITLARKVLQRTEQVLIIVEEGAQKIALESGIPTLPADKLVFKSDSRTSLDAEEDDEARDEDKARDIKECIPSCVIEREKEDEQSTISAVIASMSRVSLEIEPDFIRIGAVGAVAYDRKKRLASGTSTAGEPGKLHGIVSATGTSIGCGIYVDQGGSVSVSGCDKAVYAYAPARRVAQRLREEQPTANTVAAVLKDFEQETGMSDVGAIAVTSEGAPLVSFRYAHFPWAYCNKGYVYYGCARNERLSEKIDVLERPPDCVCEDSDE